MERHPSVRLCFLNRLILSHSQSTRPCRRFFKSTLMQPQASSKPTTMSYTVRTTTQKTSQDSSIHSPAMDKRRAHRPRVLWTRSHPRQKTRHRQCQRLSSLHLHLNPSPRTLTDTSSHALSPKHSHTQCSSSIPLIRLTCNVPKKTSLQDAFKLLSNPPEIYLGITSDDASIVYYKISQGIVKPPV